jgi:hypothetical protein
MQYFSQLKYRGKQMKALAVKFSDAQLTILKEVSDSVGIDVSKVSRAALRLGLAQIAREANKNNEKAVDTVTINNALARNSLPK